MNKNAPIPFKCAGNCRLEYDFKVKYPLSKYPHPKIEKN